MGEGTDAAQQYWESPVPSPPPILPVVLGVKGFALRARRLWRCFVSDRIEMPPAGLS
jgi:hypothetical protein